MATYTSAYDYANALMAAQFKQSAETRQRSNDLSYVGFSLVASTAESAQKFYTAQTANHTMYLREISMRHADIAATLAEAAKRASKKRGGLLGLLGF